MKMLSVSKKFSKLAVLANLIVSIVCSSEIENIKQIRKESDYRLPKSIVPTAYDIKYTEVNFETFTFKGIIKINALVKEETHEIVLHRGNLTASVIALTSQDYGKCLVLLDDHYNKTTEKWTIMLEETLKPSDEISIQLNFNGMLRDDMLGFYRSSYFDESGKERWLAATQFEATYARDAFPCFDEPAFKAKFNVSILLPDGFGCLGNMPSKIDKNWCIFDETFPMSTYLVAFVISDFAYLSNSTYRMWSKPNTLAQTQYSLQIVTQAIDNFNREFDSPYPLPKLDVIALPDYHTGAMENWGLITFSESNMLYDENETSDIDQQRIAATLVHECTHMWFGDLVTPEWWGYVWLSEGFASYFQCIATDQIIPNWRMDQQFIVDQHQIALGDDALETSAPMTSYELTQGVSAKMFGTITYLKGASIIRMMERTFGHEVFMRAIRHYLKEKQYQSVIPDDLWQAFQTQLNVEGDPILNISVAEVMRSWTEQPGFPYVRVIVEPDCITLSQERFLLRNLNNTVTTDSIWTVPITWTSPSCGHSTKPIYWLSERNAQLPNVCKYDDWLIFNVESAGFYRVLYDKNSWDRIIRVLMSDDFEKIHEENRAALVDDLLNFARAELLNYETALRGIQYLKKETKYLPFKSAFKALDYLIRKFSTSPDNDIFKEYVFSLFKNIHKNLTYYDKLGDDRLTVLLRQELNNKACALDDPECIAKSQSLFSEWRIKQKLIPKNQKSAAYCTAIKYGTNDDWNFLYNQYQNSNVATEKLVILKALGCTRDTTILERYLLLALLPFEKSHIRKQDVPIIFNGVLMASAQNAEFMLNFLEEHFDSIIKYYYGFRNIGSLISGIAEMYPTKQLAVRLESIVNKNVINDQSIILSLKSAQKVIDFELAWQDKYLPIITNWIKADRASNQFIEQYCISSN